MIPLPIIRDDMKLFQDQVYSSSDIADNKTLVLFIHDAPDVVINPNALVSPKMDLSDAYLVNPDHLSSY
jgi:hypothetical protein